MILHSYKHAGSVAFPTEISVDFETLPPVVGIMGRNGGGKTTFLDTLVAAFYLQMPFRPDPLHQQFATRGYIDVVWSREPGGKRYRSRVNVDPEAGRTEAVLYPAEGGKAIAGPLQRNYLAEIGRLLGPLDLFLCSAYTTQQSYTSGKSAMTFLLADRAARRGVMSDLLGLSMFGLKQASARDRIKAVETQLNGLRVLARQWETELEKRPAAEKLATELEERWSTATDRLDTLKAAAETAQEALREAKTRKIALAPQQQAQAVLVAELNRLRRRDAELADAIAVAEKAIEAAQAAAHAPAQRNRLVKELAGLPVAERALKDVNAEILALESELEEAIRQSTAASAIIQQAAAIEVAQKTVEQMDADMNRLAAEYEEQVNLDAEAARTYQLWRSAQQSLDYARIELRRVTAQMEILDRVPCRGQEAFAGCQFLTDA
ncbi:MAG TPA: hypothetical protein VLB12_12480, partial [Gemmatimonadales bacterium]|nr:hypothetical protein [Gemmatimonadales bacterium]